MHFLSPVDVSLGRSTSSILLLPERPLSGLVVEAAPHTINITLALWCGWYRPIGVLVLQGEKSNTLVFRRNYWGLRSVLEGFSSIFWSGVFGGAPNSFEELLELSAQTALRVSPHYKGYPLSWLGCSYTYYRSIFASLLGWACFFPYERGSFKYIVLGLLHSFEAMLFGIVPPCLHV